MAYLPPDPCGSEDLEFVIKYAYIPPDPCGEVTFLPGSNVLVVLSDPIAISALTAQTAVVSGGQESNLPIGVGPGSIRVLWNGNAIVQDSHKTFPFEDAVKVDPEKEIPWQEMDVVLKQTGISYSTTDKVDLTRRFDWQELLNSDISTSIPYRPLLPAVDFFMRAPWLIFSFSDRATSISYSSPAWKDSFRQVAWDEFESVNRTFRQPFGTGETADKSHRVFWGPYWWSKICNEQYFPPLPCQLDGVPFVIGAETESGICQAEFFVGPTPNVRCPVVDLYSGIRDKYIKYTTLYEIIYPEAPALTLYYAQNSATITVLPETDPPVTLDFYSIQIEIDKDSWLWGFSITLPDSSYLDLVKPSPTGELTNIEITINGHTWTCMVEGWQESRSFGAGSWQITGRSPTAVLAAPYDLPGSGTNTEVKQGGQLASQVLQYSGFDVDWQSTAWLNPYQTWLVPEGIFKYLDQTRIEALRMVTNAAGAYIQTPTNPLTDTLLKILPRFPIQPWNWRLQLMPVHDIVEEQCWEIARTYVPKPLVNAVIVSGTHAGVVCNVVRSGTAGDKPAPTITHDLITSVEVGTELARGILGDSGQWIMHTIRLFSLYPPGQEPDLLKPGDIISVTQSGVKFYGQVTGVTITATVQDSVLNVTQTVEVEEPVPEN